MIGRCPYTVGRRLCVAGPAGHPGRHDWPSIPRWRRVAPGEYAYIVQTSESAPESVAGRVYRNGSRTSGWTWTIGTARGESYAAGAAKDNVERIARSAAY